MAKRKRFPLQRFPAKVRVDERLLLVKTRLLGHSGPFGLVFGRFHPIPYTVLKDDVPVDSVFIGNKRPYTVRLGAEVEASHFIGRYDTLLRAFGAAKRAVKAKWG